MMPALETLLLPFTSGQIKPALNAAALFLNAQDHPYLKNFDLAGVQYFKPYAAALERAGFNITDDEDSSCDFALVLGTKSRMETEIFLARAVTSLKEGGMLIAAADNKEGAGRLKKMLQSLGFDQIAEQSKNKSRVCWSVKKSLNKDVLSAWLAQDNVREIAGGFFSRPGIYGWDKIDKGSALLADNLPSDLKGHGADFGCGYGYLSKAVLEKNPKIKSIEFMDADSRAVAMTSKNLEKFEAKKTALWCDLTLPSAVLDNKFDWIVMNPPFHEGKKSDSDIGVAFIKNAYASLRRKGVLYMVANNQLPYERVLSEIYFESAMIAQGGGFKVFRAVK